MVDTMETTYIIQLFLPPSFFSTNLGARLLPHPNPSGLLTARLLPFSVKSPCQFPASLHVLSPLLLVSPGGGPWDRDLNP